VVSATDNPAWATDLVYGDTSSSARRAWQHPRVSVRAGAGGYVFGVPLGISFFGTAFSEPTLIKLLRD